MRALISVYDKTDIIDLAMGLHDLGWEIVSSGGTARVIRKAGIPVIDTEEITGFPAILGHRVMTLHPNIHGGLLGIPDDPEHQADMAEYGIEMFDLMVGNLYPFGADPSAFAHGGGAAEDLIDIGGPAMIRAAAKNHAYVGVVTSPDQYKAVLDELKADGQLSAETREKLAREAFAMTAAYDAAVVTHYDESVLFPPSIHLTLRKAGPELQYGENPHQGAALYKFDGTSPWWDNIRNFSDEGARKPGYLNIFDGDAGLQITYDLANLYPGKPNCVIIKHANPCGLAVADSQEEAYRLALSCDPKSAFGGIVVFNQPLKPTTAKIMADKDKSPQADVIIAPEFIDVAAITLRKRRKQTRILKAPAPTPATRLFRQVDGGFLVQEPFTFQVARDEMRVVTERQPTEAEWQDALLAHRLSYWGTSNTIALVKDGVLWGLGVGQQNRVDSGYLASRKANSRAAGGACGSDAFYPFADGIEEAYVSGAAVVIQPGGSVKDEECIAKADELDMAMIFTGERHFKH